MKPSTSTVAFGLLLSVAAPCGVALAMHPGIQILLEQANFWRAQQRYDLAAKSIDKLLALDPAQPDALYQAGLLARQRGDSEAAQAYFDRLRRAAPSDPRAGELTGAAAQGDPRVARAAAPASAPARLSARVPEVFAASADSDDLVAAVPLPRPSADSDDLVAAVPLLRPSADSDDLIATAPLSRRDGVPAAPAPARPAAMATEVDVGRSRQLAALPVTTISDGDTEPVPPAPRSAGNGVQARSVQVAQLELMPPLPVGGYQRPIMERPYSPDDTLEMDIDRSLAQIQAESNPTLIAGLGLRAHGGNDGLDRLTEIGMAIEGSFSPWLTGTARLTVLPVYLDAGTVSSGALGQFGANPLLAANGSALIGSGAQNAGGVGILGGYSYLDFSAQVGTSPLGFPVTNLVGNVAYAPKFFSNTLTVRIEGLRQPVTDSVLSYAGTHASLGAANAATAGAFGNNSTWGGVVRTGGRVTVLYDDNFYGVYGGGGAARLTGVNVPGNGVFDGLLGTYFRPYKTEDDALRVGIALYYMGYNRNLSGFTFGQGGYFSPHNYESLTFPVEYTGRSGNWSYLAAVAVGVQHFNVRSSPIFPNNPFAESALVAAGGNANLAGSSSIGPAFSGKGQIEYAIDNTLSIGASASIDNGNSYTEGIGKLYIRKTFDWLAPINTAGDPSVVSRDLPQSRL
jgi:hypothetical protein